jgi:signal peptidase I
MKPEPSVGTAVPGWPQIDQPDSLAGMRKRRIWIVIAVVILLFLALLAGGGFLFYRISGIKVYYIPSPAMEPTLMGHDKGFDRAAGLAYKDEVHDHVMVYRRAYLTTLPKRGEIIVFNAEKKADKAAEYEHREPVENVLVKRVIGLPNETVEFKEASDGKMRVFVNDHALDEPYIKEPMTNPQPANAEYTVGKPIKLGADEVFVLGDNRNNSNDSRFWGPLPLGRVIGKVTSIIAPAERERTFP